MVVEFSEVIPRPDLEKSHIRICVNKTVDDGGARDMSLSTSVGHVTDSTYPVKHHRYVPRSSLDARDWPVNHGGISRDIVMETERWLTSTPITNGLSLIKNDAVKLNIAI